MTLPFAPLEAAAYKVDVDLCRALHLSSTSVNRYREKGLTVAQADKLAVRLGVHPWFIFGDAFWADVADDAELVAA